MHQTDDEILKAVQAGDRSKYMELFDRHYSRVESYARRQLQNAETARDVASETFLRAYLAYLLMICHRLTLTELARRRATPVSSLEEHTVIAERLVDHEATPVDRLLEGERRAMLRVAMDSLPPDDREIIHLAYERDLSRQDIVTILGKPSVSAVTSHLYRAMQKLKAVMVQQGYFAADSEVRRK